MSQTIRDPKMDSDLPSFENPPVVEVVMGVQFQPLNSLQVPHFGRFWETVRPKYSECTEKPPIVSQIEDLGRPGALKDSSLQISQVPPIPRVWFECPSGEWLIQLQRDRFLHNWRSSGENPSYPRYPTVRDAFFTQWSNFRRFVADEKLGNISITQLDITYLNHIAPWNEDSDLGQVFPDFRWREGDRLLGKPEACNISCAFALPDNNSRLRATIKPGIHQEKGSLLQFELTVRGLPADDDHEGWFDSGRRWIVTAFADLTSGQWHEKWGRTR
jgi:uncharacterized protein (TIGR04255 family)